MTQDQLPPQDAEPAPAMELLEGDATHAPPAGTSRLVKIARGAMYGMVLLAATTLLAVSAVPELANYASFVPEKDRGACSAAMAGGSHCTALDKVNFESPCCAAKAMARFDCDKLQKGGCCPASDESAADEALVATTAASSCCSAGGCPLSKAVAQADEPIDAGSLLAAADEPADQQADEDGTELEPDDNEVKE